MKERYGFMSLLGHGAMISRSCFTSIDGFPLIVAEDLGFAINSRNQGYLCHFAPDIVCQEEFPVDYAAFRKRHSKWTQGNMEFIKNYTGKIVHSSMKWYEKLDIFLFSYSLPLTFVFFSYLVICVVILPLLAEPIVLPAWLLIPTIIFLIAPMLNDAIVYRHHGPRFVARYSILSMILYGSMFTTSLITSAKSSIGGSVFLVTPKETERVSVRQALTLTRKEQGFFIILVTVSMITTQSVWPVALIVIPALFSICLTMMHNKRQIEPTSRHKRSLVRDSSQSKAG